MVATRLSTIAAGQDVPGCRCVPGYVLRSTRGMT